MPLLTAVRATPRGTVALDVDGARWRIVPAEVALGLRLAPGIELDRPLLRTLGRELRRRRALDVATRAIARRPRSRTALDAELERRRVRAPERKAALGVLERYGAIDDARFAEDRAAALADRGAGDAMILSDLERQGVALETARVAVAGLAPEHDRARTIVEARGRTVRTARYLAQRGFPADVVAEAVAIEPREG